MPSKESNEPKNLGLERRTRRKIRICPVCKRPTLRPADSISGWMTAELFACYNCGYRGHVYVEVDAEEIPKLQEELADNELSTRKDE